MPTLRCIVFGVENVLVPSPGIRWEKGILQETGKLVRYLRSRGIEVAVLSNRQWQATSDDGTTRSLQDALRDIWKVDIRWLTAGVHTAWKQTSQAMADICHNLGLNNSQIVFVGNTETDMHSAVNGGVLLLNAQWYGKSMDYGFEFAKPIDIARFVEVFCLRDHFWYFKIEEPHLKVYALAPYSTQQPDKAVYSYDFLNAVKDENGDGSDFWAKYLCTSMYFSGLYKEVKYISPYPKHSAGEYPTILQSPLTRFAKCFRTNYIPDLVVRHSTAMESKKNRPLASHINQVNTIYVNRNPIRTFPTRYQSFPIKNGKTVVVLDDILTEGYSLDTARAFLSQAGGNVICVSLLKTINRPYKFLPTLELPNGPFRPNTLTSTGPVQEFAFANHIVDPDAVADLHLRLSWYRGWTVPQ